MDAEANEVIVEPISDWETFFDSGTVVEDESLNAAWHSFIEDALAAAAAGCGGSSGGSASGASDGGDVTRSHLRRSQLPLLGGLLPSDVVGSLSQDPSISIALADLHPEVRLATQVEMIAALIQHFQLKYNGVVLIIIDNVHHCDEPSQRLLEHLFEGSTGIVLVTTSSPTFTIAPATDATSSRISALKPIVGS